MINEDPEVTSSGENLKNILHEETPHLTFKEVDTLFGGDSKQMLRYLSKNVSPRDLEEKSMMVIKSTSKIIRRKFIIFSGERKQLKKQVIDPGPIFKEDKIYNLLFTIKRHTFVVCAFM